MATLPWQRDERRKVQAGATNAKYTTELRTLRQIQTPLPMTPSSSFITLQYNSEKHQHLYTSNLGEDMADRSEGAFQGTRSRSALGTPCRSATPTPRARPVTRIKLRVKPINSEARTSTPLPISSSEPVELGSKRKSALRTNRNGDITPERARKRVRVLSNPTILNANDSISSPTPTQTPNPQSAVRTPSLKLKFGPPTPASHVPTKSAKGSTPPVKRPKAPATNGSAHSSAKKRKAEDLDESDNEASSAVKRRPSPTRKPTIKLKTNAQQNAFAAPVRAPTITLKAKGKIPKKPLGAGYDSELEDRELDPVLHHGFILRMQPGPDCDYIQKHINEGTIGVHRAQGGADVQIRVFDVHGRRGVMTVRKQLYAVAMVDLPCIIEGMKSWDRKGWIKSVDICQMLLVLGKCHSDEEAKEFPLPRDVDPKTMQYAHGMTPPMRWVRKRRFGLTKRARIDDIESVERRVNALLAADDQADLIDYKIFDHDPRNDEEQSVDGDQEMYSEAEDDNEDAEGEEEEPDNYFASQSGERSEIVDTPVYEATDAGHEEDHDDIAAELMEGLMSEEDVEQPQVNGHLRVHDGASSFAVTSRSTSPNVTGDIVGTPASQGADADQPQSPDDEDEESDADNDDDASDNEEEDEQAKAQDEERGEAIDRIRDFEAKIRSHREQIKHSTSVILKAKLKKQIEALQSEIDGIKRRWGWNSDDDEEENSDGDQG